MRAAGGNSHSGESARLASIETNEAPVSAVNDFSRSLTIFEQNSMTIIETFI